MAGPPSFDDPANDGGAPIETRLESVEEIRRALQGLHTPTVKHAAPGAATRPFKPGRRPPLALLHILDDGSSDGEVVRVRLPRLVIGRSDGDVRIPHDDMISSRHAEVGRQCENNRWRWYLADLDSTNGTYVRAAAVALQAGHELLLGSRRYRFDLPAPATVGVAPSAGTLGWQAPPRSALFPALVELKPSGEGARYPLDQAENWLGRDAAQCTVAVDDPLLNPRHARFRPDRRGRWQLDSTGTVNGIWLRVGRVWVEGTCHFQLGEQRFLLRVLS